MFSLYYICQWLLKSFICLTRWVPKALCGVGSHQVGLCRNTKEGKQSWQQSMHTCVYFVANSAFPLLCFYIGLYSQLLHPRDYCLSYWIEWRPSPSNQVGICLWGSRRASSATLAPFLEPSFTVSVLFLRSPFIFTRHLPNGGISMWEEDQLAPWLSLFCLPSFRVIDVDLGWKCVA